MWKNSKIVSILVSAINLTFFGIMRVNFILEGGKCIEIMKDKNLVKVSNIILANINLKVFLVMGKGMALVFCLWIKEQYIKDNGLMDTNMVTGKKLIKKALLTQDNGFQEKETAVEKYSMKENYFLKESLVKV